MMEKLKEKINIFRFLGILALFLIACLLVTLQPGSGRKDIFVEPNEEIKQRPAIIFDAYKEQVWSIMDTGFAGYSSLNLFLKNLGYHTVENHKPYNEVLASLDSETLFVIGVAMEAQFTEDEIRQILDFVGRGGDLLVIAEHDNKYNSADFLRPIINAGGWEINNDRVIDRNDAIPNSDGRWIKTVLPSKKEGPILLCAATLTAIQDNEPEILLASLNGGHIVAGQGRYKKGQITIITDSEFLWNGKPDFKWERIYPIAFNEPRNVKFVKDLIFRIFPLKNEHNSSEFSFSGNIHSPKRVFVYGNGGDFQNYTKFLKALTNANIPVFKYKSGITPEDGVIVISPLKKIPGRIISDLSKSEKMVLFGDMYSCLKSYADSWEFFFKPRGVSPVPYPMNKLAKKYGVSFLPNFGVNFSDNEHGNILYIPVFFKGRRFYLHRACAVETLEGKEGGRSYLDNSKDTFACGAGFGLNHPLKSMDPNDMKNPNFFIAKDNVLAIGDADIISNSFFDETRDTGIIDEIIKFLKFEK